ncbi:MAG: TonB-dependent receptor [Ekhidna sp.]|nr:TonB-dependent receptor [Ekhidna sp.]
MRIISSLFTLFITVQSFAQSGCNGVITGQVLDIDTQEPLSFATVKILNSANGVISDAEGNFTLNEICKKEVDFEVRFVGYKTVTHHHDFRNSDHVNDNHIVYLAREEKLLKSVVVEGEKIVGDMQSISVDKISQSQLALKPTQSLASVISSIQGVTFNSVGSNVQLPVIHGLYGNRILIINNGVKHGFQNWGTDHAPEIDIASANNVTVLKGADGVRFGSEALGGVIVIEGNPLKLLQKTYGGISTSYQTNGQGYHANANFGAGYKKFSYHVGGNYLRIGDRHTPDYSLTNTGKREYAVSAGFRYHLPKWDFKIYYSHISQELGLLRASVAESGDLFSRSIVAIEPLFIRDFSYTINEPKQIIAHHLAKLEVDWYSGLGKISLLSSRQTNLRQEFDVRRNADLPIIDLQLNTSDTRLEWYHPPIGGLEGTLGLEYFSQNNDNNPGTGTTPLIPNYNTHRFSVYAIESIQTDRNIYELGLRLDHEYNSARGREQSQEIFRNEFSFTNLTASLGLVRDLTPHWQLRSNLGSAWRTPNMAELYSFGQHSFKVEYGLWRYYMNEDEELRTDRVLTEKDQAVKAEKGFKWINELSHQKNGHTLKLTAYINFIENFTFDRPLTVIGTFRGPMPAFIIDRADALFTGADITYSRSITKKLKGKVGTSYLWSLDVQDNEALINQPPININAEITWETPSYFGLDFSKLSLETSYTFRQFQAPPTITPERIINREVSINPESEIFDFKNAPNGYFLGHAGYEWKKGRLSGQFQIRNVLNTSYRDYLNQMRYFADEEGINYTFRINYLF